MSLSAIVFRQEEDEQRNQVALARFCRAECQPTGVTADGTGLVFGAGTNVGAGLRVDNWNHEKGLTHLTYHMEYSFNEDDRLKVNLVSANAKYDIPNRTIVDFSSIPVGTFTTDHSGGVVRTILDDPSLTDDASDFAVTTPRVRDQNNFDSSDLTELKIDYEYNPDEGVGFAAGAAYRDIERRFDVDLSTAQVTRDAGGNPAATFADFTDDVGSYSLRSSTFPIIDVNAVNIPGVIANNSPFFDAPTFDEVFGNDISVDEKVTSAYGGIFYRSDLWYWEGGLRYEKTDVTARPFDSDTSAFVIQEGSYSNVLPNLNFTYNATDNVKLRGGISKSLGRPSHSQINGSISRSIGTNGVTTLRQGNPALEPRVSTNYDLSLEYFFGDGC